MINESPHALSKPTVRTWALGIMGIMTSSMSPSADTYTPCCYFNGFIGYVPITITVLNHFWEQVWRESSHCKNALPPVLPSSTFSSVSESPLFPCFSCLRPTWNSLLSFRGLSMMRLLQVMREISLLPRHLKGYPLG